jgi:hypothetical protein
MKGACNNAWERPKIHTIFIGKPKGQGPLESVRHRWAYNIKMDLKKI